ncbi:MAG: lytic transglycosylase domain-containing protein [Nanoarchaeota archaeon]|nr:lytic transglycosylase domain-containing protein [Nanoarchaeota archaeon]
MGRLKKVVERVVTKPGYFMVIDAVLLAMVATLAPKVYSDYQAARQFRQSKPAYETVMHGPSTSSPDPIDPGEQVQDIESVNNMVGASAHAKDEESTIELIINTLFGRKVNKNTSDILTGSRKEKTWKYNKSGGKEDTEISVPLKFYVDNGIEGALAHTDLIIKYSEKYNLPEELIASILAVESEGRHSTSSAGASGLMQLMPDTARYYGLIVNDKIDERMNPEKNLDAGAHYMADLLAKYDNNVMLALAAYNGGPTIVNKALKAKGLSSNPGDADWDVLDGKIYSETNAYCIKVMSRYQIVEKEHETTLTLN